MSAENVELVHRAYEAWNRGDTEWLLDHVADELEIRTLRGYLDLAEVYRGRDGFDRFASDWRDAWDDISLRAERVEELGGERLMTLITHRGIRRTSGVAVTEEIGHLVTVRKGRIEALVVIEGWDNTLEAAGLSE